MLSQDNWAEIAHQMHIVKKGLNYLTVGGDLLPYQEIRLVIDRCAYLFNDVIQKCTQAGELDSFCENNKNIMKKWQEVFAKPNLNNMQIMFDQGKMDIMTTVNLEVSKYLIKVKFFDVDSGEKPEQASDHCLQFFAISFRNACTIEMYRNNIGSFIDSNEQLWQEFITIVKSRLAVVESKIKERDQCFFRNSDPEIISSVLRLQELEIGKHQRCAVSMATHEYITEVNNRFSVYKKQLIDVRTRALFRLLKVPSKPFTKEEAEQTNKQPAPTDIRWEIRSNWEKVRYPTTPKIFF